jgi:sugar phosphate isomerase/epimerase
MEREAKRAGGLLPVPRENEVGPILALGRPMQRWHPDGMSSPIALAPVSWQRMAEGIESVKNRLDRAAAALGAVGVKYAVVGGNAVAAWVSRVDASAVRNTRDVDILLRREDMDQARLALEAAGFVHRRVSSLGKAAAMDVFLDGPDAKVRDAVHILWAGEKAVPDAIEAAPELRHTEPGDGFELVPLEDLVRMKLTAFRDKDRMHLRDLASVGLVDGTWPERFPATLGERLQVILDDPEG